MSDHRQMACNYSPGEIDHVAFLSEDIGTCLSIIDVHNISVFTVLF